MSENNGRAMLEIRDLRAEVEGKEILKGIDLTVTQGETHALMGPNGSGKSTLSNIIMGRPGYVLTGGDVIFKGEKITGLTTDQRAKRGLFLALQYPTEVPGVSVVNFLRTAYQAVKGEQMSALAFRKHMKEQMDRLGIEDAMVQRYVNQGFSGGEKKRNEVLQLAVLQPEIAILDETDSGLDIDSLKLVAGGVAELVGPDLGVLLITHYQRILNYITADRVHVMMQGRIVRSGGPGARERARGEGLRGHPRGARDRGRGGGGGMSDRTRSVLDVAKIREDFPILERVINGHPLVYLDSAATSQKPRQVIDAVSDFYANHNANAHRGIYTLGEESTEAFEGARAKLAAFFGAPDPRTIVFTRGTTESLNLVAQGWGRKFLREGDEILLTDMEHHSNIVPWQLTAQVTGAVLRYIPLTDDGQLDLSDLGSLLNERTKILSVTGMSNALGTITPLGQLVEAAHAVGAVVAVDAAQLVPHNGVSVTELDCDFLAFSGHKMLGPTASGGLYAKAELLEAMDPMFGGGEMIHEVFHDHSTWKDIPYKFEAGTMQIAQQVGLGVAVDYLQALGMDAVRAHEEEITRYALDELLSAGATIYGPKDAAARGGAVSFWFRDVHPHDLATVLDAEGVAIRAGHHCAQLVMRRFDTPATARASFYVYNTRDEVDVLVDALAKAEDFFR